MSASFDRRSRHLHERLPARGALDPACLPSVQEDVYGAARHTGLLVWISLFVCRISRLLRLNPTE